MIQPSSCKLIPFAFTGRFPLAEAVISGIISVQLQEVADLIL